MQPGFSLAVLFASLAAGFAAVFVEKALLLNGTGGWASRRRLQMAGSHCANVLGTRQEMKTFRESCDAGEVFDALFFCELRCVLQRFRCGGGVTRLRSQRFFVVQASGEYPRFNALCSCFSAKSGFTQAEAAGRVSTLSDPLVSKQKRSFFKNAEIQNKRLNL